MSINQRLCPLRFLDQHLGLRLDPQDFLLPYYDFHKKNVYTPWFSRDIPKDSESTMKDDKDNLKIIIDVQHFKPNELNVKVSNKEIVIEGSHEERQDEHGFISRKFSRRYILPINCPPENVTSTLSSDGILTVLATKKYFVDDDCREKNVPIKFCGACPYKEKLNNSTNTDTSNKDMDTIIIEDTMDKNKSQITLKDHSCLLNPELLAEAVGSKEKIIDKTKQMDDLFKTSEKLTQESSRIASEIIEGAFGQTSKSKGDMETFGQCSTLATEQKLSSKSKEVSELQETFKYSSKSHETKTGETKSEYISDVINAEHKEASENI